MALPRLETRYGLELQFLTNHVGHFLLVTGLLEQLAPRGRVVVVSSAAHRAAPAEGIVFDNLDGARGYRPWQAYGITKLANLLFARELARRLGGGGRTANALHPGVIPTRLARYMAGVGPVLALAAPLAFKTVAEGAATQCYLAAHPAPESVSGEYFADCNPASSTPQGRDDALAARLWSVSEDIAARLP
jgi:NAD(P)-dependent dehydrogenase (short-subunit alcohol dehydrogenase family)